MDLPASDRRAKFWAKYGPEALRSFKKIRGALDNVLLLIDVEEKSGQSLTRAFYACVKNPPEGFSPDVELAKLKSTGQPCVLTIPLVQAVDIFTRVKSKIAGALNEEPLPGQVRVIIISKGYCVLHGTLPVPPEGLN